MLNVAWNEWVSCYWKIFSFWLDTLTNIILCIALIVWISSKTRGSFFIAHWRTVPISCFRFFFTYFSDDKCVYEVFIVTKILGYRGIGNFIKKLIIHVKRINFFKKKSSRVLQRDENQFSVRKFYRCNKYTASRQFLMKSNLKNKQELIKNWHFPHCRKLIIMFKK